ncbi:MAG TPA: heavy metal translocating P-type ATPase [Thermomicrobiales bacterium]|nr:heavy metal translocating P-type ATPase [Thermomicrobiales bacterium]
MSSTVAERQAEIEPDEARERRRPVDTSSDQPGWLDRYSMAVATALTALFLLAGWLLGRLGLIGENAQVALYGAAYVTGGTRAAWTALRSLWRRHIDVDLLMVLAAIGAAIIGSWLEGGILLFLFSLGNTREHYAMGRTHSAIRALMDLRPEEALVLRDGAERVVLVEDLVLDDTVIVRPGERIPADGDILRGQSEIDQSAITGESMPVARGAGESVFAGTINGRGVLHLRVTRLANESVLAKIIDIVDKAQAEKSATQRFTDRFEGLYAGGVIAAAALYAVIPALFFGRDANDAFYQAMILLVVASPCALVISTPASTLSALANAARNGILFKGAAHLEDLGVARVIAFDKTGTLTAGRPRLTDVVPIGDVTADALLALTAAIERHSEHSLASAVVEAAETRNLSLVTAGAVEAVVGRGIQATVDGALILIGNDTLFAEHGHPLDQRVTSLLNQFRDDGKSTMIVGRAAEEGVEVLGVLAVADTVRPAARTAIEQLRELGIEKTLMLTGDNQRAAGAIARQTGIAEVRSDLLPAEKLDVIAELQHQHGVVVMVGDGVNDAPALAAASIGVAMGAAGTDVALETADVVLMADDLTRLPYAVALSRRTRRIIRQNLTFALAVITILVSGTLLGITTLSLGVVGHEGSTIVVVLNGLRLLGGVPSVKRERQLRPVTAGSRA